MPRAKKIKEEVVEVVEVEEVVVEKVNCDTCVEVSKYDTQNVFQCGNKTLTREEYEKLCK